MQLAKTFCPSCSCSERCQLQLYLHLYICLTKSHTHTRTYINVWTHIYINVCVLYISYSVSVTYMCLVAQLCSTLCNPMYCSLPVSSVQGILQARILELVAIPFSRGSSRPRGRTLVSCIASSFFTN